MSRAGLLDGVTDYGITRFFGGSNREGFTGEGFTTENTEEHRGQPDLNYLSAALSPELHRDVRSRRHMGSSWRGLLAGHAAAYGFKFQSGVLGGL